MNVSELEGSQLNYWVALAEGYVWARNATNRSGDGYRQHGEPKQWPIDARCLIAPQFAKGIEDGKPNWDGWLPALMSDPLAPAWNRGLPQYANDWGKGGPIIGREHMTFQSHLPKGEGYTAFMGDEKSTAGFGATHLIAAMRAYVASKFGDTVPDEAPQ